MTTETTPSAMQVDPALVRQLAELLDETSLTEIEVQDGDRRIRVARTVTVAAAAPAAAVPVPAPAAAAVAEAPAAPSTANAVKSPMVGTVYLAGEPGAADFITVGATVKAGDTLVIIAGVPFGVGGQTNFLKVHNVGESGELELR